jgi:muramoyltetrapeptide carboxypeptidase LdcA involved in peptidoglycan recycling
MQPEPFQVPASETWSDDPWYMDQENREFHANDDAYLVLQPGQADGRLLGGNLCTFNLLQGTPYMPALAGSILLIEDDFESAPMTFDRDLQSLCHQPGFDEVRGLLIGRFQVASEMSNDTLKEIIARKPELAKLPVVANASFGHTTPQFTFPQGGSGRLLAEPGRVSFEITVH